MTLDAGRLSRRLRATAVLAFGALLVHQGRYMLGYGGGWREILMKSGHEYFALVIPVVLAVMLGGALLFAAECRLPRGGLPSSSRRPSFARSWAVAYLLLCSIYAGQELTEGLLSSGHASGLAGVLANGGWIAFLLALAVAALVALVLRSAEVVLARRARVNSAVHRRPAARRRPATFSTPSACPVGRNLAPRGPPIRLL